MYKRWQGKHWRLDVELFHFSRMDSSYTWIRLYIKIGRWWKYPIVITRDVTRQYFAFTVWHKKLYMRRPNG